MSFRRMLTPIKLRTRKLPVENWHDIIGEETIADAILDRLVHTSHRIELRGESLRKKRKYCQSFSFFEPLLSRGSILPEYPTPKRIRFFHLLMLPTRQPAYKRLTPSG
ncbi:MAG: hypothetical protein PWQ06_1241 [Anaerophaga sp.]|nr:hypothetical protein [Anaerophaga sp.]